MDQGFTKKLSSKYIANVDLKYRLRSVNNEGDNSSYLRYWAHRI